MDITAKATRSGDWWAVEVPAIAGLFTQARRLEQVQAEVRDAASLLGVDVESVKVEPNLSAEDARMVEVWWEVRAAAESAMEAASAASRQVVFALRNQGLTVRDVASILGVSAQRVSVLDRERV